MGSVDPPQALAAMTMAAATASRAKCFVRSMTSSLEAAGPVREAGGDRQARIDARDQPTQPASVP